MPTQSLSDELQNITNRLPNSIWNLLLAIFAILSGLLAKKLITISLNGLFKASKTNPFRLLILKRLSSPANVFLPVLMLELSRTLMRMNALNDHYFDKALQIALLAAFAAILIGGVKLFEDYVSIHYDLNKADNLKERKVRTQIHFIRKFLILMIVILTFASILLSFDSLRRIGADLLTGVGIGGIIIGFAAQKSLGNLLAGFQIAFTQPIRIDDVLVVEGEYGRVEDITLTYVVLKIWDERRLVLPITYFIEKPFQNWTRNSSDLLGTVFLYMDYTIPIEKVRQEFLDRKSVV